MGDDNPLDQMQEYSDRQIIDRNIAKSMAADENFPNSSMSYRNPGDAADTANTLIDTITADETSSLKTNPLNTSSWKEESETNATSLNQILEDLQESNPEQYAMVIAVQDLFAQTWRKNEYDLTNLEFKTKATLERLNDELKQIRVQRGSFEAQVDDQNNNKQTKQSASQSGEALLQKESAKKREIADVLIGDMKQKEIYLKDRPYYKKEFARIENEASQLAQKLVGLDNKDPQYGVIRQQIDKLKQDKFNLFKRPISNADYFDDDAFKAEILKVEIDAYNKLKAKGQPETTPHSLERFKAEAFEEARKLGLEGEKANLYVLQKEAQRLGIKNKDLANLAIDLTDTQIEKQQNVADSVDIVGITADTPSEVQDAVKVIEANNKERVDALREKATQLIDQIRKGEITPEEAEKQMQQLINNQNQATPTQSGTPTTQPSAGLIAYQGAASEYFREQISRLATANTRPGGPLAQFLGNNVNNPAERLLFANNPAFPANGSSSLAAFIDEINKASAMSAEELEKQAGNGKLRIAAKVGTNVVAPGLLGYASRNLATGIVNGFAVGGPIAAMVGGFFGEGARALYETRNLKKGNRGNEAEEFYQRNVGNDDEKGFFRTISRTWRFAERLVVKGAFDVKGRNQRIESNMSALSVALGDDPTAALQTMLTNNADQFKSFLRDMIVHSSLTGFGDKGNAQDQQNKREVMTLAAFVLQNNVVQGDNTLDTIFTEAMDEVDRRVGMAKNRYALTAAVSTGIKAAVTFGLSQLLVGQITNNFGGGVKSKDFSLSGGTPATGGAMPDPSKIPGFSADKLEPAAMRAGLIDPLTGKGDVTSYLSQAAERGGRIKSLTDISNTIKTDPTFLSRIDALRIVDPASGRVFTREDILQGMFMKQDFHTGLNAQGMLSALESKDSYITGSIIQGERALEQANRVAPEWKNLFGAAFTPTPGTAGTLGSKVSIKMFDPNFINSFGDKLAVGIYGLFNIPNAIPREQVRYGDSFNSDEGLAKRGQLQSQAPTQPVNPTPTTPATTQTKPNLGTQKVPSIDDAKAATKPSTQTTVTTQPEAEKTPVNPISGRRAVTNVPNIEDILNNAKGLNGLNDNQLAALENLNNILKGNQTNSNTTQTVTPTAQAAASTTTSAVQAPTTTSTSLKIDQSYIGPDDKTYTFKGYNGDGTLKFNDGSKDVTFTPNYAAQLNLAQSIISPEEQTNSNSEVPVASRFGVNNTYTAGGFEERGYDQEITFDALGQNIDEKIATSQEEQSATPNTATDEASGSILQVDPQASEKTEIETPKPNLNTVSIAEETNQEVVETYENIDSDFLQNLSQEEQNWLESIIRSNKEQILFADGKYYINDKGSTYDLSEYLKDEVNKNNRFQNLASERVLASIVPNVDETIVSSLNGTDNYQNYTYRRKENNLYVFTDSTGTEVKLNSDEYNMLMKNKVSDINNLINP